MKAYFESRGGLHPEIVFFGLQYILKRHLCRRVTLDMIDEAEEILGAHFGNTDLFNRAGWEYIAKDLDGKIPIRVCAVPEGTVVPVKNVLFTVESTDERVPWVANYFEALLVQTWQVILQLILYLFQSKFWLNEHSGTPQRLQQIQMLRRKFSKNSPKRLLTLPRNSSTSSMILVVEVSRQWKWLVSEAAPI